MGSDRLQQLQQAHRQSRHGICAVLCLSYGGEFCAQYMLADIIALTPPPLFFHENTGGLSPHACRHSARHVGAAASVAHVSFTAGERCPEALLRQSFAPEFSRALRRAPCAAEVSELPPLARARHGATRYMV